MNALKFEYDLERNLFQLQKELKTGKYKPGRSICFVVKEPVPREIFAASFKDRVVHHLLTREILKMGERIFIFDSFACRKNKGTHLAVKRLKGFIRKISENYNKNAFYAQLDISGFFMSINHHILYAFLRKMVLKQDKPGLWKKEVLRLAKIVIFHKPTKNYLNKGNLTLFELIPPRKSLFYSGENSGLPIGNYSSQFFANLYLNEIDQFIKRNLKCKHYVRYVDDLILLDRDKEKLKLWRDKINQFLKENLKLKLSLRKQRIQSLKTGIDFLGYFIKPDYVLVRRKVVNRLKNRLNRVNNENNLDLEKVLAVINSYYSHFKHAFSFNLRKNIYQEHLVNLQKYFFPDNNYALLKIYDRVFPKN